VPIGEYRAYVHVEDEGGVPVLVEVQDIRVATEETTYLLVNLLEGAGGLLYLREFDSDGDLAIDRVELACGTDMYNAAQIPGRALLPLDDRVLEKEGRWYRGELYARSRYGEGSESVAQLVRRAEKAGLDFLAIADRNTMASVFDPEYHSESVVLIPALEWGTREKGSALIYGPRTVPDSPSSFAAAQAECFRVQAQGGLFAVAHPCFPDGPWLWGLSHVNAVQVWCRDWRAVPPMLLDQLPEDMRVRDKGKLVHSIAAAANSAKLAALSANAQAERFYDYELVRGLMASVIAGSASASPKVALGQPITYIYANEKSLRGLMDGLRMGRTYVSHGPKGPHVFFSARILGGQTTVPAGGVVPLDIDVILDVEVLDAKGKKVQIFFNGRPILTKIIDSNVYRIGMSDHPIFPGAYRVRVIESPEKGQAGVGDLNILALGSPIYAQDITKALLWQNPDLDVDKTWIRIESDDTPAIDLPEDLPSAIQVPSR
jgi:hypothetical protein